MTKDLLDFEVAIIIAEKKSHGIGPVQATAIELASKDPDTPYGVMVGFMRELAREGKYKPSVTVNKVPILMPL